MKNQNNQSEIKVKKKLVVPLLVFVVSIAITVFVWQETKSFVDFQKQERFRDVVEEAVIRFEDQSREYINILYGGRGLFAASESVERDEWTSYIKALNLQDRFAGIQALEFIERVSADEKDEFIFRVKSDTTVSPLGYPDFDIYPAGEREEYFVVNYIEPFAGNEKAFGFDLGSNPARLEALEKARDTGLPVTTAPITLVQETEEQAGFLVFLPMYEKDTPTNTTQERQDALRGFILAVFRAGDLTSSILSKIMVFENISIEIFDAETNTSLAKVPSNIQGIENDKSFQPELTLDKELKVADRLWKLHFEELPEFALDSTEEFLPFAVLAAGLIFSFLILGILYSFSTSRSRALSLAKDMTTELQKFKLAVEHASDQIVISNPNAIILYANKAAEKITGYSQDEIIGKNPGDLWGGQMDIKFYKKLWKTIKEKKSPFTAEIKNKRKNGEMYDVEARISPILDERGEIEFFVEIGRDITKAKQIDRAKTEFVSLASHQLRTPLSSMNWNAEMMLDGDVGKLTEEQKEFIQEIYNSTQIMTDLVNALLNVSRIDLGTFAIDPEPTELKELATSVLKELESLIKGKQQNIKTKYDKLPKIPTDPQLMRIVFQNLLSNAVKYTPEKGKVSLEILNKKPDVLIKVSDTGYGIPKDQQDKIFQKLFRAGNVVKKNMKGTGLGLYIVKAIVEESGGKIWFESAENKGATFYVSLPLEGMKKKEGSRGLS